LYQSAVRLFAQRPPDLALTEKKDHKTYQVQLWDTEGLPFTIDHPEPVRVVRSGDRRRFTESDLNCQSHGLVCGQRGRANFLVSAMRPTFPGIQCRPQL
jgi:hypothetical protein